MTDKVEVRCAEQWFQLLCDETKDVWVVALLEGLKEECPV
jgi:hypothetical protein